jgi:hypothetical protein
LALTNKTVPAILNVTATPSANSPGKTDVGLQVGITK